MPFTLDFGQSFNHYALEHLIHSCTCKFCNTWKDVNILKQNCWAYKYSILLCIRPTISFKQSHLQKENLHIILRTFKITFCHFHRISIKHSNNIYQKIALKWCVLNTGKYGWIHYLLMFNSGESFFFFFCFVIICLAVFHTGYPLHLDTSIICNTWKSVNWYKIYYILPKFITEIHKNPF